MPADEFVLTYSPTGFMNLTVFTNLVETVWLPEIIAKRAKNPSLMNQWAMIIMDVHPAHQLSQKHVDLLKENKILLLFIPPGSGMICQPLDLTVCSFIQSSQAPLTPTFYRSTGPSSRISVIFSTLLRERMCPPSAWRFWTHAAMPCRTG
jgi:hypothetical protein